MHFYYKNKKVVTSLILAYSTISRIHNIICDITPTTFATWVIAWTRNSSYKKQ